VAVRVKRILLWRGELDDRPGALAEVLEPIAAAGANLEVVMGYYQGGNRATHAVIEIAPVAGKRLTEAVEGAGLVPSAIPALLVRGGNRAGLAHRVAHAIAGAGIDLRFLMAQTVGRSYSAVLGFEKESDAERAVPLIRAAAR
jgi:hypothetical protein